MKSDTLKSDALINALYNETGHVGQHNCPERWVKLCREVEETNARLRENLEFTALANTLVKCGLIEQNAIEDPEWYDGGITCDKIKKARDILANELFSNLLKP